MTERSAHFPPRYAELHAHSAFSFLDGASQPEELAAEASRLGLRRARAHRPRRALRRGPVRAGGQGGRAADRVRGGAAPARPGRASAPPGEGRATPGPPVLDLPTGVPDPRASHLLVLARGPDGYRALSRAIAEAHLRTGPEGRRGLPAGGAGGDGGRAVAGAHRLPQGLRPAGARGRGPVGVAGVSPTGIEAARTELDRLVALFGRDNVAVEITAAGDPYDTDRADALAAPRGRRRAPARRHRERALRHPARRRPGRRARGGPCPVVAGGPGRLAARRPDGAPAVGHRDARAAPPAPVGRGDRGGPGRRVRVRPVPRRAAAAALPGAARPHRGHVAAGAGPPGRARAVRAAGVGEGARRVRAAGARAHGHRGPRVPGVLPGGLRPGRLLPAQRDHGAGPRLGRQLRGLLRAAGHRRGRGAARSAVRAVPGARARRAAGHRRRHRVRAPRGGHPVRLREARPDARRAGGQRHLLPAAVGGPGRRPGARVRRRAAGRVGAVDRAVGEPAPERAATAAREAVLRAVGSRVRTSATPDRYPTPP